MHIRENVARHGELVNGVTVCCRKFGNIAFVSEMKSFQNWVNYPNPRTVLSLNIFGN